MREDGVRAPGLPDLQRRGVFRYKAKRYLIGTERQLSARLRMQQAQMPDNAGRDRPATDYWLLVVMGGVSCLQSTARSSDSSAGQRQCTLSPFKRKRHCRAPDRSSPNWYIVVWYSVVIANTLICPMSEFN